MESLIYLDNNSTTRIDDRVLEAMLPYFTDTYGNASSNHHFGLAINSSVSRAREKVAGLISANENDIIFTSSATESINLALKGFALANLDKGKHIITVETEHKAVLDTCKYLEALGFEISYLPVNRDGLIDLVSLKDEIRNETILVSVMLVNNEIGVIQPVKEIAGIAHEFNAVFFCDATQAVGKIEVNVNELGIDMMAFSGHKFYGPKGIGGMYVKDLKRNRIKIETLLHGGGHENSLRSGTLNVTGIVGIGKACEIAMKEMKSDAIRIDTLRNELERELLNFPNSFVNGSKINRIYNVTNISFPGVDANMLIGKMKNIAVSNGSACTSSIVEPSHVLKAMGLSDNEAFASIRFSIGKYNTIQELIFIEPLLNLMNSKSDN